MRVPVVKSSDEFFSNLVDTAVKNQQLEVSDHVKMYLIGLLSENVKGNNLIRKNENNPYAEMPIAIVFQQSLLEPVSTRRMMLKFVGDYSLYIGGYFSESLNRKIIDVGYYSAMGGRAFENLSRISGSSQFSDLYFEIFNKFSQLIDVLTEISFETSLTTCFDLIRLYDRWLHTGSVVLEKKLIEKGIITTDKKLRLA